MDEEQKQAVVETPDQNLMNALQVVAASVLGREFNSIYESLTTLDSGIRQALDAMKRENDETAQNLKRDLSEQINVLARQLDRERAERQKSQGRLEESIGKRIDELQSATKTGDAEIQQAIDETKAVIERDFADYEANMEGKISAIYQALEMHHKQLEHHSEQLVYTSNLLGNVARVFAIGQTDGATQSPQTQPQPTADQ